MATENIKVGVEVSSNGTLPKTTKEAEGLNSALKSAADNAARIPRAVAAARQAQSKSSKDMEVDSSALGLARSVSTGTGAAGRDFAKQSEGLGGLVRLYAIYAANLYAAGAAFNAMSRAMDTSNMVKGLDQLGMSSGRNLGTLSKNLALASDGAISLRDSMESVAKASSAGLSSKQIMDLGEVAKTASQALGLSMPDALNRLSRGVSKIEPELLDELGIFVRLDDAVAKYAASVNKSVSSLTDFERRQAFANAVIQQGKDKFSNIKIDVNPYNKLLASFQNLAQAGLELVNKVLGPVINLLAESPIALASAIALVGTTLLKSALPALASWREGLRNTAAETASQAKRISDAFGDTFQTKLESIFNIPKIKSRIADLNREMEKVGKVSQPAISESVKARLEKTVPSALKDDTSEKQIANLNKLIDTRQQYIETGKKGTKNLSEASLKAHKEDLDALKQQRDYIIATNAQRSLGVRLQEEQSKLAAAYASAQAKADKPLGRFDPERLALEKTQALMKKYNRTVMTATAAETAQIIGVRAAWKELNQTITDQGLKGLDKWTAQAQGGLAAVGSRVMGLIGKLGQLGMIVGIVTGIFSALDSLLSNTSKESAKTAQSFEQVKDQLKFVDKLRDNIESKGFFADLSGRSLSAKATAIKDLTDSIVTNFEAVKDELDSMNWWDTAIDKIKSIADKDLVSKAADSLSKSIAKIYSTIPDFGKQMEEVSKFKAEYGVDPRDVKAVDDLINSQQKYLNIAPKLRQEAERIANVNSKLKNTISDVDTAFSNVQKTLQDFITSVLPTDPLAKFGLALLNLGNSVELAFTDMDTKIATTLDILQSPTKLTFFDNLRELTTDQVKDFLTAVNVVSQYKKELESLNAQISKREALDNRIASVPETARGRAEELARAAAERDARNAATEANRARVRAGQAPVPMEMPQAPTESVQQLKVQKENVLEVIRLQSKVIQDTTNKVSQDYKDNQIKGAELISKSIYTSFKLASIEVTKNFLGMLGDSKGVIELKGKADQRALSLQIAQIKAQKDLVNGQIKAQLENNASLVDLTSSVERLIITIEQQYDKPLSQTTEELKKYDERKAARDKKLAELNKQATDRELNKPAVKQQQETMLGLANKAYGFQIAGLQDQKRLATARTLSELAGRDKQDTEIGLKNEAERLATANKRIKTVQTILPYLDDINFSLLQENETAILRNEQAKTTLDFNKREATARAIIAVNAEKAGKKDQEAMEVVRGAAEELMQIDKDRATQAEINAEADKRRAIDRADAEKKNIADRIRYENEYRDTVTTLNQRIAESKAQQFTYEEDSYIKRIEYEESLGLIKAQTLVEEKARIELLRQERDYAKQTVDLEIARQKELQKPQERIAQLEATQKQLAPDERAGPQGQQIQQQLDAEQALVAKINTTYTAQKSAIDAANVSKKYAIELTKEQQLAAATLKDTFEGIITTLNSLGGAASTLATVLEGIGKAVSKYNEARLANDNKYAADSKAIEDKRLADIKALDEIYAGDAEGWANARVNVEQETADKRKKLAKDKAVNELKLELDKDTAILGSTKKLFKEKTAAYKGLNALEKTFHMIKLGIMLKERMEELKSVGITLSTTASKMAAKAAEAGMDGTAAILKTLASIPFPWNVAAGALVAGIVAKLLSKIGKSSGSVSAGSTAQGRQETQGTGMTWKPDGTKVETGRGTFGDAEAKLDTINNSLRLLRENTIDGLGYDVEMVRLLASINASIGRAAISLFSVQGIRTGTFEGVKEGTQSGKGFFGTGLFASKTSTQVIDAGIKLEGTLGDLLDAANNTVVKFYETVQTTSKTWYGKTKTATQDIERKANEIGAEKFLKDFSEIFVNASNLFKKVGIKAGLSGDAVLEKFKSIDIGAEAVRLSAKGLKGEELTKELNAFISGVLDVAATEIFDSFKVYRKFGEDLLTTTIRVIDTNDKINTALKAIGAQSVDESIAKSLAGVPQVIKKKIKVPVEGVVTTVTDTMTGIIQGGFNNDVFTPVYETITDTVTAITGFTEQTVTEVRLLSTQELRDKSFEITESIASLVAELAGEDATKGLDIFTNQIKFFRENFLTEAERLAPVQENVNKTLSKLGTEFPGLGISANMTREQFKKLVQSITNLSEKPSQELLAKLLAIQTSFDTVADAAEAFDKRIRALEIQLLETSGQTFEAIIRKRLDTINALTTDEEKSLQRVIYAQEDRQKVQKLELELLQATGFAYEATVLSREKELLALSESERVLKRLIYAAQDKAKTDSLEIELLDAQGNATESTRLKRIQELKGLSLTDQALKLRIYRLQDERKIIEAQATMEEKIYTLLGKKSEALAISRKKEMDSTDEALRPGLAYIYALEDEATLREELTNAYEKQRTSVKDTITSIKDSIKALKDYKNSLLLGDLSPLTPEQKYNQAKQEALRLAAVASSTAVTEAERQAQKDALDKLPSATDSWLQASRVLYASSASYTKDFDLASSILDNIGTKLEGQLSDAEKQLNEIEKSNEFLNTINDNTRNAADILADLRLASQKVEAARSTAGAAGFASAGGSGAIATTPMSIGTQSSGYTPSNIATIDYTNQAIIGTQGWSGDFEKARKILRDFLTSGVSDSDIYNAITRQGITSQMIDTIMGWPTGTSLQWALDKGFPAFQYGGLATGNALVGETGPEIVDFNNPGRVYSANNTATMIGNTQQLITEIKQLREEVARLREEQREQTGHLITTNYDANNRAAERVIDGQQQVATSTAWKEKLMPKVV